MNAAIRTSLDTWRSCVFGAATLAALFASTACSPDPAGGPDDRKPSGPPSATGPVDPASPASSPTPGGTPSAKATAATGTTPGTGNTAACAEADLSLSATSEDEKGKTVRHILLTVTNTSDKKCDVYRYPRVQLGDAKAPVAEIKDSAEPGKPSTTLEPGKQAHAALLLNGPMDEAQAKTMTVVLQGLKGGNDATEPIGVALPGVDVLFYNDFARVTHWTTASGYALRFIMSS
ncbi:hypothetical protein SAVIM338S_07024 [Streptomyces avidinii]